MTGSGTPNPSLTLVATIGQHYSDPGQAQVPPGVAGPDTGDGRIEASPVFDGSRIWFAHGILQLFHPATVRFGYINLAANTVVAAGMTVDPLYSYEFNGSVGVGLNADGTEAIFLNWAYTDINPNNSRQVSDAIDAFVFNGSVPSTFGDEQTLLTGTAISTFQFGSYSSVAVEPQMFGVTTCAITTQEYFDGTWNTRLARVCSPTTIGVPYVLHSTVAQAAAVLAGYDLSVGRHDTTTSCDPSASGTILATSPATDQPVPLGSSVGITECTAPTTAIVPDVTGETVAAASSDIRAAGLVVGSIGSTPTCDVTPGTIASTSPRSGNVVPIGSTVNMRQGTRPKTPCP